MKKIVFFVIVGIILIGCATNPLTQDGKSIEGVWVREDGTKLTFSRGRWELVSIEDGDAGYGNSYKFLKNGKLFFKIKLMINLKNYMVHYENVIYPARIKPFQKEAIQKFRELYPDRIIDNYPNTTNDNIIGTGSSTGNSSHNFILDGDTLIISETQLVPNGMKMFYSDGLSGTFRKLN